MLGPLPAWSKHAQQQNGLSMNPAPEMSKIPEVPPLVPVRVSNTHEVPVVTQLDAQAARVIVQNHAQMLEQMLIK